MKIGILTFHYAHNYGAVLQAYALKEYLSRGENTVELIDYRNPAIEQGYQRKLPRKLTFRKALRARRFRQYITQVRDIISEQSSWSRQNDKFQSFIRQYLLRESQERVEKSGIGSLRYDLIISGSDQLWNKYLTNGYDDIYFLNFETEVRKAFYAISDGNSEITEDNLSFYRFALKDIEYISTREATLAEDIRAKLSKKAIGVVDPSFLLSREDYITALRLRKTKGVVFAYYVVEDPFMSQIVRIIANALHLEILELHYYKKRYLKEKYMRADLGPVDFLNGIYSADFVVTNSFHGTAFSIIFGKQFYCVYQRDARKDNLLASFDLRNRKIQKVGDMDLNAVIDYSRVDLDKYTEESKSFLSEVMSGL